MKYLRLWLSAGLLAACNVLEAGPTLPPLSTLAPTLTAPPAAPTAPPATLAAATPAASATPVPGPATATAPPSQPQFIAYVRDGQLLVTDVTGGLAGGTTQYTQAGVDDQVADLAWSPSGEFVAFSALSGGEPHVFVVYALGAGSPVDLGPGFSPAWSPDSTQLAFERDSNLWLTPRDAPAPRPLTSLPDWAWGQPTFLPDGSALLVTENSRAFVGAQGNTFFTLERLELDGGGALTPLPGAAKFEGGRLPYDVRFSPDQAKIAFSTSFHLSACASSGAYYIQNADGSDRRELISPTLAALLDPAKDIYHIGYSYAWSPASDAIAAMGGVFDCTDFAGTLLGSQLSVLGLDGKERLVIPGVFNSISYDRSGAYIAAARFPDWQSVDGSVQIYSAQSGQLVLDLGPGTNPQFQP